MTDSRRDTYNERFTARAGENVLPIYFGPCERSIVQELSEITFTLNAVALWLPQRSAGCVLYQRFNPGALCLTSWEIKPSPCVPNMWECRVWLNAVALTPGFVPHAHRASRWPALEGFETCPEGACVAAKPGRWSGPNFQRSGLDGAV